MRNTLIAQMRTRTFLMFAMASASLVWVLVLFDGDIRERILIAMMLIYTLILFDNLLFRKRIRYYQISNLLLFSAFVANMILLMNSIVYELQGWSYFIYILFVDVACVLLGVFLFNKVYGNCSFEKQDLIKCKALNVKKNTLNILLMPNVLKAASISYKQILPFFLLFNILLVSLSNHTKVLIAVFFSVAVSVFLGFFILRRAATRGVSWSLIQNQGVRLLD